MENQEKGEKTEQLIAQLLSIFLFPHYIYKNPKHPSIRDNKEICDILIILKNTALVIQIKNIQLKDHDFLNESYEFTEKDLFRDFLDEMCKKDKKLKKNIEQCWGAAKIIQNSEETVTLKNCADIEDKIDLKQINEVYALAYYHGDKLRHDVLHDNTKSNLPVHIMCYEPFLQILKEIYSIRDLINYLDDKAKLMNRFKEQLEYLNNNTTGVDKRIKQQFVIGNEADLFAYWNKNRSFKELLNPKNNPKEALFFLGVENEYAKQQNDPKFKNARQKILHYIEYCYDLIKNALNDSDKIPNYKLIADAFVDLTLREQIELSVFMETSVKVTMIYHPDRDNRYCIKYYLHPLDKPQILYMFLISYNPRFNSIVDVLFRIHAFHFIDQCLHKFPNLKTIIGIMGMIDYKKDFLTTVTLGYCPIDSETINGVKNDQMIKKIKDMSSKELELMSQNKGWQHYRLPKI